MVNLVWFPPPLVQNEKETVVGLNSTVETLRRENVETLEERARTIDGLKLRLEKTEQVRIDICDVTHIILSFKNIFIMTRSV